MVAFSKMRFFAAAGAFLASSALADNDGGHFVPKVPIDSVFGGVATSSSTIVYFTGTTDNTKALYAATYSNGAWGAESTVVSASNTALTPAAGGIFRAASTNSIFTSPYGLLTVTSAGGTDYEIAVTGISETGAVVTTEEPVKLLASTDTTNGYFTNVVDATVVATTQGEILLTLASNCQVSFYTIAADTHTATAVDTIPPVNSGCTSFGAVPNDTGSMTILYRTDSNGFSSGIIGNWAAEQNAPTFTTDFNTAPIGDDLAGIGPVFGPDAGAVSIVGSALRTTRVDVSEFIPALSSAFNLGITSTAVTATVDGLPATDGAENLFSEDTSITDDSGCAIAFNSTTQTYQESVHFDFNVESNTALVATFIADDSESPIESFAVTYTAESSDGQNTFKFDRTNVAGSIVTENPTVSKETASTKASLDIIFDRNFVQFSGGEGTVYGLLAIQRDQPFKSICFTKTGDGKATVLQSSTVTFHRTNSAKFVTTVAAAVMSLFAAASLML